MRTSSEAEFPATVSSKHGFKSQRRVIFALRPVVLTPRPFGHELSPGLGARVSLLSMFVFRTSMFLHFPSCACSTASQGNPKKLDVSGKSARKGASKTRGTGGPKS